MSSSISVSKNLLGRALLIAALIAIIYSLRVAVEPSATDAPKETTIYLRLLDIEASSDSRNS